MTTVGVSFVPERVDLFTGDPADGYDAGREALALCAGCPHREPCLEHAVAHNEQGIWGASGGGRRRALRRHWGTPRWTRAVAAHWRRVDAIPAEAGDDDLLKVGGDDRTHGVRATYAAGCRCGPCSLSAALEGQLAKVGVHRAKEAA